MDIKMASAGNTEVCLSLISVLVPQIAQPELGLGTWREQLGGAFPNDYSCKFIITSFQSLRRICCTDFSFYKQKIRNMYFTLESFFFFLKCLETCQIIPIQVVVSKPLCTHCMTKTLCACPQYIHLSYTHTYICIHCCICIYQSTDTRYTLKKPQKKGIEF